LRNVEPTAGGAPPGRYRALVEVNWLNTAALDTPPLLQRTVVWNPAHLLSGVNRCRLVSSGLDGKG
jgi:hypothetical protein